MPTDPALPTGPTTVIDAQCGLCAKGASWIARNDRRGEFGIVPMQSPLGEVLMRRHGLDPTDPTSWLYLEDGRAYTSMDAVIRVGRRLGGRWRLLSVLRVLPRPMRNGLYRCVARNRYRVFGRADLCSLPDPAVQARLRS